MKNSPNQTLFAFLIAGAIGFAIAGCNCGQLVLPGVGQDGGGCTPGIDCPVEGTCVEGTGACTPTGLPCCTAGYVCGTSGNCEEPPPEPTCIDLAGDCDVSGAGLPCCTPGVCNSSGKCAEPPPDSCKSPGESCNNNTDCCNGNPCGADKKCSANRCRDVGQACTSPNDCCTLTCGGDGLCAALANGGKKVIGQQCGTDPECASENCQGGYCAPSYSCKAAFDLCTTKNECCNGNCTSDDGVTPGFCDDFGGCRVEGQPCAGASNCCSSVCADQGYGQTVCVPVGGCRIQGTTCSQSTQCCGYTGTGSTKPNVVCEQPNSQEVTTLCNGGTGCNAIGNVCGKGTLPDGGQVTVPGAQAPASCCTESGGKLDTCNVDSNGVPRCFGGGTVDCPRGYTGVSPCCIAAGDQCAFKDQCCNGNSCLPDVNGVLRCTVPPSCAQIGDTCDPGANPSPCCSGTACLPTSEITYACQIPTSTPDGGTACKSNGDSCTASTQCCSQICDATGKCAADQCVPQGSTCTANSDCCTGNSCIVAPGATSGTCQSSTCQNAGQTCSPTLGCCNGLKCIDGSGLDCTGTGACSCQVILQ